MTHPVTNKTWHVFIERLIVTSSKLHTVTYVTPWRVHFPKRLQLKYTCPILIQKFSWISLAQFNHWIIAYIPVSECYALYVSLYGFHVYLEPVVGSVVLNKRLILWRHESHGSNTCIYRKWIEKKSFIMTTYVRHQTKIWPNSSFNCLVILYLIMNKSVLSFCIFMFFNKYFFFTKIFFLFILRIILINFCLFNQTCCWTSQDYKIIFHFFFWLFLLTVDRMPKKKNQSY